MKTLDDEILDLQRMARCSRYWARAARATAAEFEAEYEAEAQRIGQPDRTARDVERMVDLRTLCPDKRAEARRHDAEAEQLEALVRRLEEMRSVLQSFRIAPPDEDGEVWLWLEHPGSGKQAGFNLGRPALQSGSVLISHNAAALVEAARLSALGDRPDVVSRSEGVVS